MYLRHRARLTVVASTRVQRMASPLAPARPITTPAAPGQESVPTFNGVLCVYKPAGLTSNAALSVLKRIAAPRVAKIAGKAGPNSAARRAALRVGHGGTLDKGARGLLVVGFGKGTKQLGSFLASEKAYLATAQLGLETDSHDADAQSTVLWRDKDFSHVTRESLEAYLAAHYCSAGGIVSQTPPLFSALKQNGARLSDLARTGQAVDLATKTRPVHVYSIRVVDFSPPLFTLSITCGSGFYVRSLVRDIGDHFACGATLVDLTRTQQSGFAIADAHVITLEGVAQDEITTPSASAPSSSSPTPSSSSAPSIAHSPPRLLDPSWSFLPCTRENLLSVLAVPLEQRRVAGPELPAQEEEETDAHKSESDSESADLSLLTLRS